LVRCLVGEAKTGTIIELRSDVVEVVGGPCVEVGPLRKVLAQQAVDVLIAAALPRLCRCSMSICMGRASKAGRRTRGTSVLTPLKSPASSNPVDLGWSAMRTDIFGCWELRGGFRSLASEATVKACGVTVAISQGHSWAPHLPIGLQ
jgi:hypothetical protein